MLDVGATAQGLTLRSQNGLLDTEDPYCGWGNVTLPFYELPENRGPRDPSDV